MALADRKGWTALHHAAFGGSCEVVELLMSRGLVDALAARPPPAGAHTPLHLAAARGDAAMCAVVCANLPAFVAARVDGGRDALMLASGEGHADAVGALLAARADVRARDDDGWTALHWASAMEHPRSCAALLAAGADTASRTDAGEPVPPIPPLPAAEAGEATARAPAERAEPAPQRGAAPLLGAAPASRLVRVRLCACAPASVAVAVAVTDASHAGNTMGNMNSLRGGAG